MQRRSKRKTMESSAGEVMEKAQVEDSGSSKTKCQQQSEKVVMESRWEDILPELHQKVLQFIPIPELFRFRTVSRAWNCLTKQRSFASNPGPQQAMYIFRTMDTKELGSETAVETVRNPRRRWQIYDPSTQKSFKISMEFLYEGVCDRFGVQPDDCLTLAADKGFVSVMWNSYTRKTIHVLNPIKHSIVEVPPLSLIDTAQFDFAWVVSMVVAADYSAFTLYFLLESHFGDHLERDCAFRFHSNVGEWRAIPQPHGVLSPEHILKLDSTLFTLFWDLEDRPQLLLLAFDTARDTWSDTGVRIPRNVWGVRLATALGRLFFVAFGIVDGMMLMEIDVASFKCSLVASLNHGHDFNGFFLKEVYANTEKLCHFVVVVGCGDSIVFSSTSGATVAYDLTSSRWCEWMESWMMADGNTVSTLAGGDIHRGMYATTMSLTLNPVPAIILQQASSSNNSLTV